MVQIMVVMAKIKGPQINWLAASGSALGAVTSAVLLSTLGAAGTLIGAALGSLIITVGGGFYSYSLEKAKSGLEKTANKVKTTAQEKAYEKKSAARKSHEPITARSDRHDNDVTAQVESVGTDAEESSHVGSTPKEKGSWKQTLRDMPWKRLSLLAAGLFVVTMVIILVFELSTGRPVSSYTGGTSSDTTGTTFSGLTNRGGGSDDEGPATYSPDNDTPERTPAEEDSYQQDNQGDQDVEQDQPQREAPETQDGSDQVPEDQPEPQNQPKPYEPEQQEQAPQQQEVPEAPAE